MNTVSLFDTPTREPLTDGPADLSDPAVRRRLSGAAMDAVRRLSELWGLRASEVRALIGGVTERTWFRMKKPDWPGTLKQDELTRVSLLIGIFKNLRLIFSDPLASEWIRLPNNGPLFMGRSPLAMMLVDGIPAMLDVRRHLEALRGGG